MLFDRREARVSCPVEVLIRTVPGSHLVGSKILLDIRDGCAVLGVDLLRRVPPLALLLFQLLLLVVLQKLQNHLVNGCQFGATVG